MLDCTKVKNEDGENQEYNVSLQDCLRNLSFLDKENKQDCFLFLVRWRLKESKLLTLKRLVCRHLLVSKQEIELHGNFKRSMKKLDKLEF